MPENGPAQNEPLQTPPHDRSRALRARADQADSAAEFHPGMVPDQRPGRRARRGAGDRMVSQGRRARSCACPVSPWTAARRGATRGRRRPVGGRPVPEGRRAGIARGGLHAGRDVRPRPGRGAGPGPGRGVVPAGGSPWTRRSTVHDGPDVRKRRGRAPGRVAGGVVVPQGGSARTRRGATHAGRDVPPTATAWFRMPPKRCSGTATPPSGGMCRRSLALPLLTQTEMASRATTGWRPYGTGARRRRVMPGRKPRSHPCRQRPSRDRWRTRPLLAAARGPLSPRQRRLKSGRHPRPAIRPTPAQGLDRIQKRASPGGPARRWPNSAGTPKPGSRCPSTCSPASARRAMACRRTWRPPRDGAEKPPNKGSPRRNTASGCVMPGGGAWRATRPRPLRGSGGRLSEGMRRRCSTWGCVPRPETACLATSAKRRSGIAVRPSAVTRPPSSTLACATVRGAASTRTTVSPPGGTGKLPTRGMPRRSSISASAARTATAFPRISSKHTGGSTWPPCGPRAPSTQGTPRVLEDIATRMTPAQAEQRDHRVRQWSEDFERRSRR